jgi:alpha-glucosidase
VPVSQIKPECERPLTVELPGGAWAAIFEAGVRDYSRMLLSPAPGKPGTLVSTYGAFPVTGDERAKSTEVRATAPLTTPWRGVLVGDRAGDLAERNYLLLNLSPSAAIADTSWIKPGKVIREVTLSTRGGKECVDFAARHNLQYVEYDAGWYGLEYNEASDATRVSIDPQRLMKDPAYRGLDLPGVIRYARAKGIGILLYVNRRALEKQRDTILPLFEKWGVSGVKFGFVNVGSQYWTKWLYDSVEAAARHHLVVDVHDEFRPTGMSRTYPNLLTQEGIAGNETMPDAEHNTIMPFTRYLAGAADYTPCYYSPRIKTTRAHQLALAVVYYSPLQFLYWYDRPSASHGEPELEFWDHVKTVWDETRVLDGRPGEFAVTARRSGGEWFVGAITNGPRALSVPLAFLPKGRRFRAHIYENGAGKSDVKMRTLTADAATVVQADLPAAGGQSIWLEPQ